MKSPAGRLRKSALGWELAGRGRQLSAVDSTGHFATNYLLGTGVRCSAA
jgi:hypothetical protein